MIDFANDFADLLVEYEGIRYSAGSKDENYKWVKGSTTPFTVMAMPPQPLSSTEQKLMQPEDGQYVSSYLKLYCVEPLQQREGAIDPDELTIDGDIYQVYEASNRMSLGGHFKALIRKKQGDAQA
ncbi:head-closure protein [Vibrio phage 1.123.O._10N.286.48.F3]|nr:head-closure protein [Vibrio phage 1.123.O._10N.286.48.F3]